MTATEKQYWAGEFTDAELDAAADAGCTGMSDAYNIPNPRRKSVPMVTPEEMQAALERARQSAVLEERNRLAGEIHDGLAQSFTAICMQLGVAKEELSSKEGDPLCNIQRAVELANFGLAEARRYAHNLRLSVVDEPGLVEALKMLAERSNVVGRLRCDFRSSCIPEERLPARIQHELLRIAQEAISNAIRHGKPTVVTVTLRWEPSNLILQIKDNGTGIPTTRLVKSEGIGLRSMRERAAQIGAKLVIRTGPGRGTRIIVTVPISL
jgi:signal transduction histidine kinase